MESRVDSAATDFSNPVVHHDAYDFWIHFFEWAVICESKDVNRRSCLMYQIRHGRRYVHASGIPAARAALAKKSTLRSCVLGLATFFF